MKKATVYLLLIALIGCICYIVILKKGYSESAILNIPKTIDLTVNCTKIDNLLLTSLVTVEVTNLSSRSHKNVTIHINAYDKNNNLIKEKDIAFERTLGANENFSKPVTLPARARTCNCYVKSSNPE